MSEKGYTLDFEKAPPTVERKGRGKPIYRGTIDAFIASGKDYAKVEIPAGENLSNVQLGLKNAIERIGKADEFKAVQRKGTLYLITKTYSDKRDWVWKIERKKKKLGFISMG